MQSTDPSDDVFRTELFASTPREKVRRALELGPRYYLVDLPRYLAARRRLGLAVWDLHAFLNPLRELRRRAYAALPLPPGYEDSLAELYDCGARIAMPRLRLESLLGAWWLARQASGDVIECGAYEGATSLLLALLGRRNGVAQTVHVLDTFEGAPSPSTLDGGHRAGEFHSAQGKPERLEERARALGVGDRLAIHVGLFSATFAKLQRRDPRFAFAHIDANLFESTREACEFTLPRISPGGIVVFDDYNGVCDLGARLAIDLCLGRRAARPSPLAWCSCYFRRGTP